MPGDTCQPISAFSTPSLTSPVTLNCTDPGATTSACAGLTDHCPASNGRQAYQQIALPFLPVFSLLPGRLSRSEGEEVGP